MESLLQRTVEEVTYGSVLALQPDGTQRTIQSLMSNEAEAEARRMLTRPVPGSVAQASRLLLNPCLTVLWLDAFEQLGLPRSLRVFEPCAGGSEPVLFATEIYTSGEGTYTTINLNRPLAAELRSKCAKLTMRPRIIEDNALNADAYLSPGTFDVACFHHAINDILQTAVSETRGMDTTTVDWWPNERQMITWLAEDARAGRLDEKARPALLGAVRRAIDLVGAGGWLLFDHWTWVEHSKLDWFPWELFCDLVPMARQWIHEAGLPVTDVPLLGRDTRWWMSLRVSA